MMAQVVHKRVGEAPVKLQYMLPPRTRPSVKQDVQGNDSMVLTGAEKSEREAQANGTVEEEHHPHENNSLNEKHSSNENITSHNADKKDESENNCDDISSTEKQNEKIQPPKKKQKGQNKARPRTVPKQKEANRLCTYLLINEECKFKESCRFSHDIEGYLQVKPAELGEICINFTQSGRCRHGIECLFSKQHTTEDNKNIIDEEKFSKFHDENYSSKKNNTLEKQTMVKIRKKKYDFPRSDRYLKEMNKSAKSNNNNDCGISTHYHANIKEKKKIDFAGKLYLAPLTTLGNLPFRSICKRLGADITCGEMAMATKLLQCHQAEWALIRRHQSEDLFGAQICGGFPDTLSRVAELLNNECNVDFIDLNLGCPIDLVFKKGEGSALMGRLSKLEKIIKGMVDVSEVPITVKMRTGINESNISAHKVIPMVREWGASMVTLHGRTREQRYTKDADWDYINMCAELASPMPLFGNGDILSFEEANTRHQTSGIMIARGALIKPWIFTEIKEQRDWDISSHERFEFLRDFTNAGLMHWGGFQRC